MSDRLLVATRKGLFTLGRTGGGASGWEIVRTAFIGDPVTMALQDARDGTLYAALNLGHFGVKLHRSGDGGRSWEECAAPKHDEAAPGSAAQAGGGPSVQQVWSLETGGPGEPGFLWAGTIPGGLFVSRDRGTSWQLNRPLWERPERSAWFGGGYEDPGIHSIAVDPRDHRHLTVAVSCGGVWVSRDHGESWACQTRGMYAAYMPADKREQPEIQDPHRLVHCSSWPDVMWVQHHNGVFRSTDAAATWKDIRVEPSSFGFAVAVHPAEPATAWFVPGVKDECRIPVGGRVVVARTRDGGESFEVLREGLPQEHAYDLVYRHGLDVDATGDRLAMGSTTGSLWIGEEQGDRWRLVSAHLPPIYCVRFA
jgi:hypothetical protein